VTDAPIEQVELVHTHARLVLHRLADGLGHPLLLLHGLGERSPATVPDGLDEWPGPVVALDFSGHGDSSRSNGGGYTAELMLADVDTALRHLGPATVHGRGLGAYISLLITGARPDLVRGAILADGPGMLGGGTGPTSTVVNRGGSSAAATGPPAPDPYALVELSRDPRPTDYATAFIAMAREATPLPTPIAVVAATRPDWLTAVLDEPGVEEMTLQAAIKLYSGVA
jgi:pimeloyl-ACP methyl ester carboxylesterase